MEFARQYPMRTAAPCVAGLVAERSGALGFIVWQGGVDRDLQQLEGWSMELYLHIHKIT